MRRFYLGVDGGGTNCRVRLADQDLVTLAEINRGRANLQLDDGEAAYRSVLDNARELFASAGLGLEAMAQTFACFGMAGGRLDSAREGFAGRGWPFGGVCVFDDIDIARAGAHDGADGAVAIIGTGSAGLALVGGKRLQVGGWGFHAGDAMSGAILGRELTRRAVEAADGLIAGSPLLEAVHQKLGGANQAIMDWSFSAAPSDYGALVPLFFEHLERGDPVAEDLLEFELTAVDRYVAWFKARGVRTMAVVGGFGRRLMPRLTGRYGDFIVPPLHEPLHGALILARQRFAET